LSFYQSTSELFVGLLVAILLRAELIDGDQHEARNLTSNGRRRAALIAVVSLAMAGGELVSLIVLFSAHATSVERYLVGSTALVAVLGTAPPAVLTVLGRVLGTETLRRSLLQIAWASAAVLGVGALLLTIHLGVFAAGSVPSGSLNTPHVYRVYGTCAAGACGLNERSAPNPFATKVGQLQDGAQIGVICQVKGYALHTAGHTSRIWDQLANAAYVSDLFVSTSHVGVYSPELSKCPTKRITNHTQG
jgi:hypothetical protein